MVPDLESANCPSREILDHVTSRWGVLVLLVLRERTHRFSELRQRIGGESARRCWHRRSASSKWTAS